MLCTPAAEPSVGIVLVPVLATLSCDRCWDQVQSLLQQMLQQLEWMALHQHNDPGPNVVSASPAALLAGYASVAPSRSATVGTSMVPKEIMLRSASATPFTNSAASVAEAGADIHAAQVAAS